MKRGTIKFYIYEKNYGFITTENGEYFFHTNGLSIDYEPKIGDSVTFETVVQDKGKHKGKEQAININAS